jgi:hypothetical protein
VYNLTIGNADHRPWRRRRGLHRYGCRRSTRERRETLQIGQSGLVNSLRRRGRFDRGRRFDRHRRQRAPSRLINFDFVGSPTVSGWAWLRRDVTTTAIDVNADSHNSASGEVVGVSVTVAGGRQLSDIRITPTVSSTLRKRFGPVQQRSQPRARHNAGGGDSGRLAESHTIAASDPSARRRRRTHGGYQPAAVRRPPRRVGGGTRGPGFASVIKGRAEGDATGGSCRLVRARSAS